MEKRIFIATSGFYYPDWKGLFYPPELPREKYLTWYAEKFPFTELNFSYYRQPEPEQCRRFLESSPASFLFSIKAHRSLTHERAPGWRDQARLFLEGIRPLAEARRLAMVILQFPYSFDYSRENRLYLGELCSLLGESGELPLGVEFRREGWNGSSAREELKRREISWIVADTPALKGLPRPEPVITSDTAYLRFHGRNEGAWWTGDNVTRYDYLYSRQELAEWESLVKDMAGQVKRLFVAFNNHRKGQAVQNALELQSGLEPLLQIPQA